MKTILYNKYTVLFDFYYVTDNFNTKLSHVFLHLDNNLRKLPIIKSVESLKNHTATLVKSSSSESVMLNSHDKNITPELQIVLLDDNLEECNNNTVSLAENLPVIIDESFNDNTILSEHNMLPKDTSVDPLAADAVSNKSDSIDNFIDLTQAPILIDNSTPQYLDISGSTNIGLYVLFLFKTL